MDNPPKPRFALVVGVTGHKPNRLPEKARAGVKQSVADTLEAIKREAIGVHARHADFFAPDQPVLALTAALADGTDIMAAEAAISSGYQLDAVLPFLIKEYEKDFPAPALKSFTSLRQKARAVLELNGSRADEGKAYEAAGLALLDASDILIAVWDGKPGAGRGGTVELIYEAARRGMPIVRIDAEGKIPARIYWRGLDDRRAASVHMDDHPCAELSDKLSAVVDSLLRPPRSEAEQRDFRRYLDEKIRRTSLRLEFPLLMALLAVRVPRWNDFSLPRPRQLADGLHPDASGSRVLVESFGWADAVAVYFAQAFRSAFVSNFVISAFAIISAVISPKPPWNVFEVAFVLTLVVNTTVGQRRHWHHRWIEAREVAERLRVAVPMLAVGTRSFGPFGDPPTWTSWYVRAKLREAGIRSATLDDAGLSAAQKLLLAFVTGQRDYHRATARRFQRVHNRLEVAGKYLFISALVVASAHFLVEFRHLYSMGPELKRWVVVASASLPALAAASYGIRVIGEFDGAARRSARMKAQLEGLQSILEEEPDSYDSLRDIAHQTAEIMLGDVASWRLVVESRDLAMPS